MDSKLTDNVTYIVYDGECPFCSRYVKLLRLRETVGLVELVDARTDHPAVTLLNEKKVDLDEGMALIQGATISAGEECIHKLALMSTPSGLFNRLNALAFRSATVSRILYPPLRAGRNATLRMLGREKINAVARSIE